VKQTLRTFGVVLLVVIFMLQTTGCKVSERKGQVYPCGSGFVRMWVAIAAAPILKTSTSSATYSFGVHDEHLGTGVSYMAMIIGAAVAVLYDPLVLQVPDDVGDIAVTYGDGFNTIGNFVVHDDNGTIINIAPGQTLTAEAGHRFVVIEPPADFNVPNADDPEEWYELTLSFTSDPARDIPFKAILTAKNEDSEDGTIYYSPMVPAVTDMADVPEIIVPRTDAEQDIVLPTEAEIEAILASGETIEYDLTAEPADAPADEGNADDAEPADTEGTDSNASSGGGGDDDCFISTMMGN